MDARSFLQVGTCLRQMFTWWVADDEEPEPLVAYAVIAEASEFRKTRDHVIDPTTSGPLPLVLLALAAGIGRGRFLNLLLTDHRRWRAAGHLEALEGAITHVFGKAWDRWSALE